MSVKTYDPNRVIIVFADQHITGFAEDSMVEVSFDEQTFTKKVGVDGEVTRTRSRNECATAKLKLIQTSFSNNVLSALAILDRKTGNGITPFAIEDLNGQTLIAAEEAWVEKQPDVAFGREMGAREWTIALGQTSEFVGGIL